MILSPDSSNHMITDTNTTAHPEIAIDVPSHHREPALNLGTYLQKILNLSLCGYQFVFSNKFDSVLHAF